MKLNKRIFNSVEDIKEAYGFDVKLPQFIPEGCNTVCYLTNEEEPFNYYKEDSDGKIYSLNCAGWSFCSLNLEYLVSYDEESFSSVYIYLRLTQQQKKDKFTPKRLLGVLTDHGYIIDVGILYVTTTGYHYCTLDTLKFYISDDSDATVSFDEYVDMFYERE